MQLPPLSDVNAKCSHLQRRFFAFLFVFPEKKKGAELIELECVHLLLLCDFVLEL